MCSAKYILPVIIFCAFAYSVAEGHISSQMDELIALPTKL